jgi:hypothetical protein
MFRFIANDKSGKQFIKLLASLTSARRRHNITDFLLDMQALALSGLVE